jgi:hypothetical protein
MFQVVPQLEEDIDVLEDFSIEDGIRQYFEDNDIIYFVRGSQDCKGKTMLVYGARLTNEDILFLTIKFPDIVIKKDK